jgi:chemotaxis protein MotB
MGAMIAAGTLAMGVAGLGGCASQQAYDSLLDANRSLTQKNAELNHSVEELQKENSQIQKDRASKEAALAELERLNGDLKGRLEAAGISLKDLESRMSGLALTPLDPETDKALTALAAQYPDLIKYDSARGMLRFASDLTFNSGDDTVLEAAKQSLSALAKVLETSSAAQYEVMIVGHTDSQPISGRTSPRHATNVHLSAHRAIAVRAYLASSGVPADKMYVAGWGEYKPAVPNSANGNTPANRRVEIYLTKPTQSGAAYSAPTTKSSSGKATPSRENAPPRQPDVNK